MTGTVVPTSYDGVPTTQFIRATHANDIRLTGEDGEVYRIVDHTPTDYLGPVNDTAEDPPALNDLVCQRSGIRVTVDEGLKKEWTGLLVRKEDWDRRHPQELVRPKPETPKGSPSPSTEDRFIEDEYPSGVTVNDLG